MTGPEHYEEAARLVEASKRHTNAGDDQIAVLTAMQAGVHAKLAAVASYAERDLQENGYSDDAGARWRKAIGWPS